MMLKNLVARTALTAAALVAAVASADQTAGKVQVDPKIAAYAKGADVSGNLSSIGSDTMNNLMTYWAEGFKRVHRDVNVQVEGKGSSTAPPALIEGTAQLGPMSRDMKNEEIDSFEKKHGYKPTRLRTSLDALAVFVHRDNPIQSLSMAQVDSIFSSTRKRGGKDVVTWGDLGLTGEWADKPINLYGRNSASGTYGYFKEHALKKGDFRNTVKEQPGSASVVQGVSEDKFAIGYSGIGYVTSGVRAVPLAEKDGGSAVAPDYEHVVEGTYPLGRYLNLYVNKVPGQALPPLVREFCRFIFSKEGQEIVIKDGYLPLDAKTAEKELKLLD
jgi:phosphate transport system substrate-binding protein